MLGYVIDICYRWEPLYSSDLHWLKKHKDDDTMNKVFAEVVQGSSGCAERLKKALRYVVNRTMTTDTLNFYLPKLMDIAHSWEGGTVAVLPSPKGIFSLSAVLHSTAQKEYLAGWYTDLDPHMHISAHGEAVVGVMHVWVHDFNHIMLQQGYYHLMPAASATFRQSALRYLSLIHISEPTRPY